MWGRMSSTLNWARTWSSNRTMIPNTAAHLQQNGQRSDFSLTETLWWDLKRLVHKRIPANLNELRQCCKEDWTKILSHWCETDTVTEKRVTSSCRYSKRFCNLLNHRLYLVFERTEYYWENPMSKSTCFYCIIQYVIVTSNTRNLDSAGNLDDNEVSCVVHHFIDIENNFIHKHQKCLKMAAASARHILLNRLLLACSFTAQDIWSLVVFVKN